MMSKPEKELQTNLDKLVEIQTQQKLRLELNRKLQQELDRLKQLELKQLELKRPELKRQKKYIRIRSITFTFICVASLVFYSTLSLKPINDRKIGNNIDNLNTSSADKIVVWFFAGAFGYAAIYAIGKSISDK